MAKHWFDANKYPPGTSLLDLGWVANSPSTMDFVVTEIGSTGKYYWRHTFVANDNSLIVWPNVYEDFELLLIMDYIQTDIIPTTGIRITPLRNASAANAVTADPMYGFWDSSSYRTRLNQYGTGHGQTEVQASGYTTGMTRASARAIRYVSSVSGNHKARYWEFTVGDYVATEPTTWDMEVTYPSDVASAPIIQQYNAADTCVTIIAIGTDGESAPITAPNVVVTAPTAPTVANITDTTADLSWS